MSGGAFLLGPASPAETWTPEDLGEEHQAIGRLVDEFWAREVAPAIDALLAHEPGVARRLLTRAATLGLCSMQIPERFGGLGLDLSSVMVAVEHLAEDPSYLGWHLGHAGIGTLPLVYYGTEAQQRRYLPGMASLERLAAYALTEPQSGSDVRGLRTRATLSADGREYRLNGQKAWITNGGEADLFTVFALVGGEHLTAFLVERRFGVTSGAEERKMGLSGTSTTALYFDDVPVPAENVLGAIGRGHAIAYTVLNAGRLEMGPLAVRSGRRILRTSIDYARNRYAFGSAIAGFGAIHEKLAECAIRLFALESAVWRVVGLIERRAGSASPEAEREAFAEHAAECAIVKVAASETLDFVADEGVQIHGGYGYHRDSYVERAYRDARINRIFEGTNEVNRLLIASMLLARVRDGRLPVDDADLPDAAGGAVARQIIAAKQVAIALLRALAPAVDDWRHEQELLTRLADVVIDVFVMESAWLRTERLTAGPRRDAAATMAAVFAAEACGRIAHAASTVAAALPDGPDRRAILERARSVRLETPVDTIGLRRQVTLD
jgi:alkylation response protein AidB-like acyl-CoA dehydrogenase